MMFIRRITALAFVALAAVGALGVIAQDALSPEEAVAMRKDLMKSNGAVMQGGAMDKTGDEAIAAAQTLVDNFTKLPDLFPEGSAIEGSRALPAIWEDWDAFVAIIDTAKVAQMPLWPLPRPATWKPTRQDYRPWAVPAANATSNSAPPEARKYRLQSDWAVRWGRPFLFRRHTNSS